MFKSDKQLIESKLLTATDRMDSLEKMQLFNQEVISDLNHIKREKTIEIHNLKKETSDLKE